MRVKVEGSCSENGSVVDSELLFSKEFVICVYTPCQQSRRKRYLYRPATSQLLGLKMVWAYNNMCG